MSNNQGKSTSGTCTSSGGGTITPEPGTSTSSSRHSKMVVDHKFSSSSREMRNMAEKMRRDKLNTYVAEIASIVPLGSGANKRIDKTSVLRLAANYIRMHKVLKEEDEESSRVSPLLGREVTHSLAEAIGGFLLVVTSSGKVLYITEAVDQFFGHTQVDLLGHSIYNVIHPDDHDIFQQQLIPKDNCRRSFFCRMMEKALSRNDPGRYEIIHVVGQLRSLPQMQSASCSVTSPTAPSPAAASPCDANISCDHEEEESSDNEDEMQPLKVANRTGTHMLVSFVRVVKDRPITELSVVESTQDEYITRHGMDGKILYTDHRISFVTGLMPCEVVGTSAFNYMHQDDILWSIVAQKLMFTSTQGQGIVSYRLKCRNGDLITLRSRGFLEVNKQTGQVESFVCINTVLSVKEAKSEIKNQRRSLLPIIACHDTEDHLGSISSSLPPELLNTLKQIMNPLTMQKMIESVKMNKAALKEELESEEILSDDVSSHLFPPTDDSEPSTSKTPDQCQVSHPFQSKPKSPHCEAYELSSEDCAIGTNAEKDQWLRIAKKRSNIDDFNTVVSKRFTFERDLTLSEPNSSCAATSKTSCQPYSPIPSPYSCPSTHSVPETTKSYLLGSCQHYNCSSCENTATNDLKPKSSLNFQNTGTIPSCDWQQKNPALSPSSVQYDQSSMASEQKPSQQLSPLGYSQRVTSPIHTPIPYDQRKEVLFSPGLGDLRITDFVNPHENHNQRISEVLSPPENFNQSRISSLPISSNITQSRCEVVSAGSNYNIESYNQSTSHNMCQGMSSNYGCIEKKPNLSLASCNQSDVKNILSCPVTSHCIYPNSGGSVVTPNDQQILMPQNQLFPQYQQVSVCVSHTTTENHSPYPHAFSPHEQSLSSPLHTSTSTSPGHYLPYPPNVHKQTSSQERQLLSHSDLGHHSVPVTSSHKILYGDTGIAGGPEVPEPIIPEQHLTSEDPLYKDTGNTFANGHFQHYRSANQQGKLS